jgi:hypothetical protein
MSVIILCLTVVTTQSGQLYQNVNCKVLSFFFVSYLNESLQLVSSHCHSSYNMRVHMYKLSVSRLLLFTSFEKNKLCRQDFVFDVRDKLPLEI